MITIDYLGEEGSEGKNIDYEICKQPLTMGGEIC